MKLLTAQIVKPARICQTKYGERFALDLTVEGKQETIWGPSNRVPVQRQGEWVTLGLDSKGKFHLVEGDNTPITPTPTPKPTNVHTLDSETKREIASYITQQKDLLQFCWEQAESIQGPCTEESVQKLATTLFLAAQRKFGLA